MEKAFYTLQEVAEYLGVSIPTVRRRIKAGQLEAHKMGGQYRISREALQKYVDETKEG